MTSLRKSVKVMLYWKMNMNIIINKILKKKNKSI